MKYSIYILSIVAIVGIYYGNENGSQIFAEA
jgi:hypothetical protein